MLILCVCVFCICFYFCILVLTSVDCPANVNTGSASQYQIQRPQINGFPNPNAVFFTYTVNNQVVGSFQYSQSSHLLQNLPFGNNNQIILEVIDGQGNDARCTFAYTRTPGKSLPLTGRQNLVCAPYEC